MINFKILNLISGGFLTTNILTNSDKPFYGQEIKTIATTPDNQNIINTFIDNKNTVWISTKSGDVYYKLSKKNIFQKLEVNLNNLTNNDENANIIFVKTNYSNTNTFYFGYEKHKIFYLKQKTYNIILTFFQ